MKVNLFPQRIILFRRPHVTHFQEKSSGFNIAVREVPNNIQTSPGISSGSETRTYSDSVQLLSCNKPVGVAPLLLPINPSAAVRLTLRLSRYVTLREGRFII